MRRLGLLLAVLLLALPGHARAQVETREGIALQNQILQLRQELDALRRAAPGGGMAPPQAGSSLLGGGAAPARPAVQGDIVHTLLDRVQRLEDDLRSVRGRAEQAEFNERQLRERVEKLQGDMDFRLQQIEGQRQGAAPAQPGQQVRPATPPASGAPATRAQPAAAAGPRPPQRAIADGQAALARRDFPAAEAAAREVIASREPTQQVNAQMLLGDALLGRRDFAGAAVAYDDARRRSPEGARAPEAAVGVANAFIGLNNNGDACSVLNNLRSARPDLSGPVADRAADARRRAQCR
jgi:TolA-binding protein